MMNTSARLVTVLLFTTLLAACGTDDPTPAKTDPNAAPKTMIGKAVDKAINEARQELATENISLLAKDKRSKAEITPKGDLMIDGKTVAVDDKQRALLLEYRKRTHAVAEAAMQVGVQGADLAGKAMGEAIGSIFSGDPEKAEKKIETEAKGIEASATKMCELLPSLLETQNKLVASLPVLAPYSNMTQADVDECLVDGNDKNGGEAIGKVIESAFNQKVNVEIDIDGAANEGKNAAQEAEAASNAPATKN